MKAYPCQDSPSALWKGRALFRSEFVQLYHPAEEALSERVYNSWCLALRRTLLIQTDYLRKCLTPHSVTCFSEMLFLYLFEGLQHLGSLTEVLEDELQRARHQRRVILHDEMDQNPQKRAAALIVQLHRTQL